MSLISSTSRSASSSFSNSLQNNPLLAAAAAVAAAEAGLDSNQILMPSSIILQSNVAVELDSMLQVHKRKMLRRAANRRSAQLSRARKKQKVFIKKLSFKKLAHAHMEDLKIENSRLQRLVDILDSHPELVFCVNSLGKITYASERSINYMKMSSSNTDDSAAAMDEDPTHMNQFLTPESMYALFDAISQVSNGSPNGSMHQDSSSDHESLNGWTVSSVKEVNFHDNSGFPITGYMRCSKVVRKSTQDNMMGGEFNSNIPTTDALTAAVNTLATAAVSALTSLDGNPAPLKKGRKSSSSTSSSSFSSSLNPSNTSDSDPADALSTRGMRSSSSSSSASSHSHNASNESISSSNSSKSSNDHNVNSLMHDDDSDEEFVCVIRPADASLPQGLGAVLFQSSGLSKASMDAHDLAGNRVKKETRRGSPNVSSTSNEGTSHTSKSDSSGTNMSTSSRSETASEEGSDK